MATAEEWRKRVRRWRASGESSRVFAASIGCNARTLTWWASRLKRAPSPKASQTFDLVRVVAAPPVEGPGTPVEIILSCGHVLRVERGFDAVTLRAVIAALDER